MQVERHDYASALRYFEDYLRQGASDITPERHPSKFAILQANFLAVVQVVVYIGAIAILVIFAVMLTRRVMGIREARNAQWPFGLAVCP